MSDRDHDTVDHDDLDPHGDGPFEPHRPPKYVEGVYKPHFADPEADYVLMEASLLPQDFDGGLYWAQTDADGDAAGVVRKLDSHDHNPGMPITEGADMVVGHVYDGELELREGNYVDWNERIDTENIPEVPDV